MVETLKQMAKYYGRTLYQFVLTANYARRRPGNKRGTMSQIQPDTARGRGR